MHLDFYCFYNYAAFIQAILVVYANLLRVSFMAEITPLSEGVSPASASSVFSLAFPTFNTLPTEVVSAPAMTSLTLPTFDTAVPTGFANTVSSFFASVTLPTFNNSSPTGFSGPPTTRSSDPAILPTSKNPDPIGFSGPVTTFSPTATLALPSFKNSSHSRFSGPIVSSAPVSSAPVSSVLTTYGPVSTVAFSQLQTSFSVIGVSSNILAAEVFLYGAYFVMFGFYLNVLRTRGVAKNRNLTVATVFLFIFCTAHCALQITTTTLYNRLVSTSLGDSEPVFDRTFKDYSALAIATNAVYITSKFHFYIALLRNLEFPTENCYLSHTSDSGCRGCGLH
ncbi:hypothetical protein C8R44DRAFT_785611 [Mycena epipterygia]|nr:hypothetical protein C8R44DRAFT_785611 [Mycena epipterygia]